MRKVIKSCEDFDVFFNVYIALGFNPRFSCVYGVERVNHFNGLLMGKGIYSLRSGLMVCLRASFATLIKVI